MRHRPKLASLEQVIQTRAWCSGRIEAETELFSLGGQGSAGNHVAPGPAGGAIPMSLRRQADKTIHARVPTGTSEAKRQGYDLLFVPCSRACAQALESALRPQIDFANQAH